MTTECDNCGVTHEQEEHEHFVDEYEWYVVICPDGLIRHVTFDWWDDAVKWAEWGHFCLSGHAIQVKPHDTLLALPIWR